MGGVIRFVEASPSQRRLCLAVATAAGALAELPGVQVRLGLAEGPALESEAPFLPGARYRMDDVARSIVGLEPVLVGRSYGEARASLAGHPGLAPEARWAVECALWSGDAAARGCSLATALSGRPAPFPPVRTNALAVAASPDGLEREVAALVAAGEHTVKIKVGAGTLAADRDRVAAARSAGGDALALRLDANAAWDAAEAERRLAAFARYHPEAVEQPVSAGDLAGLARVRMRAPMPVLADESARDPAAARAVIAARAVDGLVLKAPTLSGTAETTAIVEAARDAGMSVILSSLFDRGTSLAVQVALAASLELPGSHGLATAALLEDAAGGPYAACGEIRP